MKRQPSSTPPYAATLRERAFYVLENRGPCGEVAELLAVYVKLAADDGLAWFNLGESLRILGRLREAEEALLTARELAPRARRFAVDARLGMLASRSASPRDAEKWFRLATSSSECPGWVWLLRGANLVRMESLKLAGSCLEAAKVRGDVDPDEVLLNQALLSRCAGDYKSARRFAEETLAINKDYGAAREVLQSIEGAEEARDYAQKLRSA